MVPCEKSTLRCDFWENDLQIITFCLFMFDTLPELFCILGDKPSPLFSKAVQEITLHFPLTVENSSSESLIRSNLICLGLKGWWRTSNLPYCNLSFLLWSSSSVTFLRLFCSPSCLPTCKQGRGFGRPLNCEPDAPHKTWPNVWKHLKMLLKREKNNCWRRPLESESNIHFWLDHADACFWNKAVVDLITYPWLRHKEKE